MKKINETPSFILLEGLTIAMEHIEDAMRVLNSVAIVSKGKEKKLCKELIKALASTKVDALKSCGERASLKSELEFLKGFVS